MRPFRDTRICVHRAANLIEGNLIRGLLESSGIEVELRGGALSAAYPGVAEISDTRVFVTPVNEIRAKKIIEEYESRTAQGKRWTCSHCGEANTAAFETCWQCQQASPDTPRVRD
ncbi:MAG: DUF2007 domain-containing protein [Pseudomonadota bacterium]